METIARKRTAVARTTPLCLWSVRGKGKTSTVTTRRRPCWAYEHVLSTSGKTSLRHFGPAASSSGNARPQEHGASPNPRVVSSWPCRSLAQNRKEMLKLRPKGQGARSCYCLTGGEINPYLHGNSVLLIGMEAVASPLARCAVLYLDPVPLG